MSVSRGQSAASELHNLVYICEPETDGWAIVRRLPYYEEVGSRARVRVDQRATRAFC